MTTPASDTSLLSGAASCLDCTQNPHDGIADVFLRRPASTASGHRRTRAFDHHCQRHARHLRRSFPHRRKCRFRDFQPPAPQLSKREPRSWNTPGTAALSPPDFVPSKRTTPRFRSNGQQLVGPRSCPGTTPCVTCGLHGVEALKPTDLAPRHSPHIPGSHERAWCQGLSTQTLKADLPHQGRPAAAFLKSTIDNPRAVSNPTLPTIRICNPLNTSDFRPSPGPMIEHG